MMFVALFMAAFIWLKQYKSLPFLLTGFIIFSIAGWPVYKDLLWFFTKMPYGSSGSELYGSGSFWFYIKRLDRIMHYPLLVLSITGLISILLSLKTGLKNLRDIKYVTLYLLIIPSFFGFLLVQSFLWWQGLMGVLASTRFMACVLPLNAILALAGFEWILEKVKLRRAIYIITCVVVPTLVIAAPFTYHQLPMKTGKNFVVMENVCNWLKKTPYAHHKAFYTDPMFPFYMDMDPNDQQKCFKIYNYENTDPASLLAPGDLLIWDAQFAGFEGRLPFDTLLKNKNLQLLNVFTPNEEFTIIGGEKYKLAVFIKAPKDTTTQAYKQIYVNDFESGLSKEQLKNISLDKSSSGKQSIILSSSNTYSPSAEGKINQLPGTSNISLRASARILNPSAAEKGQIVLVITTEDQDHKLQKYIVAKDSEITYTPGNWFEISKTDIIDRNFPENGIYKVYVWYTGKGKIYVDDLKLECKQVGY